HHWSDPSNSNFYTVIGKTFGMRRPTDPYEMGCRQANGTPFQDGKGCTVTLFKRPRSNNINCIVGHCRYGTASTTERRYVISCNTCGLTLFIKIQAFNLMKQEKTSF
ncbi:hypothetical protein V5799_009839, partial [Amblyomma americanum]